MLMQKTKPTMQIAVLRIGLYGTFDKLQSFFGKPNLIDSVN